MKNRYALPIFFLAVATFWFSLLLTTIIKNANYSGMFRTETALPYAYTQIEGIEELEFEPESPPINHYGSTFYIKYANQPYITLLVHNVDNPYQVIKDPFIRQGNRLIFRPTSYISENDEKDQKVPRNPNSDWFIYEIVLPTRIKHLHTRGVSLEISSEQDLTVPDLSINAENVVVKLFELSASTVHVRNAFIAESCSDLNKTHRYDTGVIKVRSPVHINRLFIESIYGHIELEQANDIGSLHLQTTPQTSMEIKGIGIYSRMHWKPFSTPTRPDCEAADATSQAASATTIKAQ